MYANLFQKGKINGLELKNRIVLSPMDESLSGTGGDVSQQAIEYYAAKAKGGCGLIITGSVAVCGPELGGIAIPGQAYLQSYEHALAMQRLADRVHDYGTKIFVQLQHPGSKAKIEYNQGHQPVSSSTHIPAAPQSAPLARELSVDEIQQIVNSYIRASEFAYWAGIDGVEVHCAHHYLLSQFINPAKNGRTDLYGGSLENRCRIVLEILRGIREKVPRGYPVTVRLNGFDGEGYEGEGDLAYMGQVAKYLVQNGANAIHVTVGSPDRIGGPELVSGWRNEIFAHFRRCVDVPLLGPNEIKTPDEAEAMLESGVADFAVLGRQLTADPEWANKARGGRTKDIRPCLSCNYCAQSVMANHAQIRCAVNPTAGREIDNLEPMKPANGTVVVIGCGPAGIQAALTAANRGFRVLLMDQADEIGGSLQLANKAPGKFRIDNLLHYYSAQLAQNKNITLKLGCRITEAEVDALKRLDPYAVILATGGQPIIPPVDGMEKIITAHHVLAGKETVEGKKVLIVGGGMTGLETAELLAEHQNEITIIEMASHVGGNIFASNAQKMARGLSQAGVKIRTSCQLQRIGDHAAQIQDLIQGTSETVECEVVISAIGVYSNRELFSKLEAQFDTIFSIGDRAKPGNIASAVRDGYYCAKHL